MLPYFFEPVWIFLRNRKKQTVKFAIYYLIYFLITVLLGFIGISTNSSVITVLAAILATPIGLLPFAIIYEDGQQHGLYYKHRTPERLNCLTVICYVVIIVGGAWLFPFSISYILGFWRGRTIAIELEKIRSHNKKHNYLSLVCTVIWFTLLGLFCFCIYVLLFPL